jgi:hypothetical protein
MDNFVTLYKDGAVSPPLHPIDASGWEALGWTSDPVQESEQPDIEVPEKNVTKKTTARQARAED